MQSKPKVFPEKLQQARGFLFSASLFRIGLALLTFEQDRPFGIALADYCLFASFLMALPSLKSRIVETKKSGVLIAGALIFTGSILSLLHDADLTDLGGSLARLCTLYGLFAPLALLHSRDMRRNLYFLIGGIGANCAITILQAGPFPGIVDLLSINPATFSQDEILRYQGLTQFPVTLGLAAALGVLVSFGLLLFERRTHVRWTLMALVLICIEGALLSGSRTFVAALFPGLAVLGLSLRRHRRSVVRAGIGLALLSTAFALLAPSAVSDYSDRLDEVGLMDYDRLVVAAQAVGEIAQRPMLGWGFNHFAEAGLTQFVGLEDPQPAHVTLLQYWYGAGILGAMGFLALFVLPVRNMLQVLKNPQNSGSNMVRLGLAVYVSAFIVVNLGPYLYNRYLYIPMFLFAGFTARSPRPFETSVQARRGRATTTSSLQARPNTAPLDLEMS
jgi:O-Antigen ligase